jgi:hypothetical protein
VFLWQMSEMMFDRSLEYLMAAIRWSVCKYHNE